MQARPLCAPAASLGQRVVPEEQEAKGSSGLLQFSLWRCSLCTPAALGCADCSYPTCPGAAGLAGLWWLCSVGWGVQHEEQALCSAWARSPPTIQNGAAPHHPCSQIACTPPGCNSPVQKDTLLTWKGLEPLLSLLKSISNACSG